MRDTYNPICINETIRSLRKARGLTKAELSERINISESHLNKIESGSRRPSIATYEKIMQVLGADIVIKNNGKSLKEKCVSRAQDIILKSTDEEAVSLLKIMECVADQITNLS